MEHRVVFDFVIEFTNGGSLQGQDFRLDIAGPAIADRILADYLVADLRLLMVGGVTILNKCYLQEPHKRTAIDAPTQERFIDLSHPIAHGLRTYPGFPEPVIGTFLSREASRQRYDEGTEFHIGHLAMVANTGTYLDAPYHRFAHGTDVGDLPLTALADLEAITIDAQHVREIGVDFFRGHELRNRAVLVRTNWSQRWNTDAYAEPHPHLTGPAAEYLRDCQVRLVGIDGPNVDDTTAGQRPVHTILLGADILIVAHLCALDQLPESNYWFSAVPPKIQGMGTFPVRAYARLR